MNAEFIVEEEEAPPTAGWLTGWENVVFQVEDDPEEPKAN